MTFGLSRIAAIPVAIAAGFWVDRFSIRKTTLAILVVAGVLTMLLTVRDVAWIERILYLQAAVSRPSCPFPWFSYCACIPRKRGAR